MRDERKKPEHWFGVGDEGDAGPDDILLCYDDQGTSENHGCPGLNGKVGVAVLAVASPPVLHPHFHKACCAHECFP